MPRRRTKKRLSRMDAAVDAMSKFGFPEERVQKTVKELLGEYGGVEAWPFIEDCSYKELLEAILRNLEMEDLGQVPRLGDQTKQDQSGGDEEPAGASNRALDTHQEPKVNTRSDIVPVADPTCLEIISAIKNAETEGNGWKDILPDHTIQETASANPVSENGQNSAEKVDSSRIGELPALPSSENILSPPSRKRQRCLPCYGWIESDEEYDFYNDFITLQPGPMLFRAKAEVSGGQRKRKSRWDEKPDDP